MFEQIPFLLNEVSRLNAEVIQLTTRLQFIETENTILQQRFHKLLDYLQIKETYWCGEFEKIYHLEVKDKEEIF